MLVFAPNIVLSDDDEALPDGVPYILWENFVTRDNVSTDSEDVNYPITNVANPATNQEWRGASDSPTPTTVTIDVLINSLDMVDAVGIARHNFGTEQIATTIIAVSSDSPPVETVLAGPQLVANDEPILCVFSEQSFHILRIELDVPASIVPRAAVIYAGELLRCERGYDVGSEFTPPRFARKTVSVNGMSHAGDFLGRIITNQMIEASIVMFKHFHADWYRDEFDPFVAAAQRDTPFFFAWAPESYPAEVTYNWLEEDPIPLTSPITGRIGVSLKMGGITE